MTKPKPPAQVTTLRCQEGAHANCRGSFPATTGYPAACDCSCHLNATGVTSGE